MNSAQVIPLEASPTSAPASSPGFAYRIAGLTMVSDVELPSAITLADMPEWPEVTIAEAELPANLAQADRCGQDWEVRGNSFLLRVDSVARFLIVGGCAIYYQQDPAHTADDLPLYLLGTCLAVLLQQRGLLVLHGSAVEVEGRAMLFCGPSGAGKSTMAARLCQAGYRLLSDDLCSLSKDDEQRMVVGSDGRMLKLWHSAIDHLDIHAQRGRAVHARFEKFYLKPPPAADHAVPLGGVYLLESCPEDEAPALEPLSMVQAVHALGRNAYRPGLVSALQLEAACFAGYAALQRQATVYRLRRPLQFARMDQVLALLTEHWGLPAEINPQPTTWRT